MTDQWTVSLEVSSADADALRDALRDIVPAEDFLLLTMVRDGERAEESSLRLMVVADSQESAFREAADTYARARRLVSLPDEPAQIIGYVPPLYQEPLYTRLRVEAKTLMEGGRHALAVLRAQTAIEVYVREAMEIALAARGGDKLVAELLERNTPTLQSPRSRGLFALLFGRRVEEQPWWPEYVHHWRRRNEIVHSGVTVTPEDAQASLDITERLRWYVEAAWAGVDDIEPD